LGGLVGSVVLWKAQATREATASAIEVTALPWAPPAGHVEVTDGLGPTGAMVMTN
jgi:hypothetical protein